MKPLDRGNHDRENHERLLKLYYSNATDPNDENIKPGRKTPRVVVEEYFKRERQRE